MIGRYEWKPHMSVLSARRETHHVLATVWSHSRFPHRKPRPQTNWNLRTHQMNADTENLEYLTVESIQWAEGHVRSRMTLAEKRAKHRVHQRQYVLRQQELLDRLRHELRCFELQLLRLQAVQESAALRNDNDSLREQLVSSLPDVLPAVSESSPTECEPLSVKLESVPLEVESNCVVHLLTLLTGDVKFDHSCGLRQCENQDLSPLPWSPTTPSAFAIV
jgi:hypothetical protein